MGSVSEKVKSPFPKFVEPMLCSLIEKVSNNENYLYEVKWDGYRIGAYIIDGKATLKTRSAINYSKRYPPVKEALDKLEADAVLDGEVVVLNDEGKHDFTLLQNYQKTKEGTIIYYIFDILWLNGFDLTQVPLEKRKEILNDNIVANDVIRIVDVFDDGETLFENCERFGFEGIVCKRKDSVYIPGDRGKYWMKAKHKQVDEFVVVGYVPSESGKSFKTLLLGKYEDGKLKYIHHSGGGYTDADKKNLFPRLKKTVVKKPPVINLDDVILDDPATWVKPTIVAQFEREEKKYKSGRQRHPIIYLGEREDKLPADVVIEKTLPTEKNTARVNNATNTNESKGKSKNAEETQGTWEDVERRPITSRNQLEIEGRKLEIVNIEKGLWHDVTKGDLINYYINIAPYILHYLKDRPLALSINLEGPFKPNFFLRGLEGHYPEWVQVFTTKRKHPKKGKSAMIEWLVCKDLATLIYMINLECIDIHPWGASIDSPTLSDYIVIDLDPTIPDTDDEDERKKSRTEGFAKAVETALAAKELFDKHKLKSFVKTSGKTGIHLYLPCTEIKYGEEKIKGEARIIAEKICEQIHELVPDITTTSFSQGAREDKVFVDYSQNDYADRVAVAYCCRANYLPTVSAPLEWKEVNEKLSPENFTIHNMAERVKKKGDLWKGLFDDKMKKRNTSILKTFL
jgi:bifunctional non-homologous end joining protein LigD